MSIARHADVAQAALRAHHVGFAVRSGYTSSTDLRSPQWTVGHRDDDEIEYSIQLLQRANKVTTLIANEWTQR